MASPRSKVHHYKPNLNTYSISIVTLLCTISYILGAFFNRTISSDANPTVPSTSSLPCRVYSSNSTALDFGTHHNAVESTVNERLQTEPEFPPCDKKYSEYTPCEDRDRSFNFERDRLIYVERHCPAKHELLKCLIPAPYGYKNPFPWPASRDVAWFDNVPHKELTVEKAVQNWIRSDGDKFRFPGGGTMFPRGAAAYIDDIGELINLKDGSIRTAIDTGCGVASWGAYLLSRDIIAMSFAPRDNHEAQVQFALERGVPAMIGVMASKRLPYPARAFDMAHCSRCLIPWSQYDGLYLTEVDRVLRPGGYWILSGPPINWRTHWKGWERSKEDLNQEQVAIESVARNLCWKKIKEVGDIAVWQKPTNHVHCKMNRRIIKSPPFCSVRNPDTAWYTTMEACITEMPNVGDIRQIAGGELKKWPQRLTAVPPRITSGSVDGVNGEMFSKDTELWKTRVEHYKKVVSGLAAQGRYRNLLDMNANLGGFAAALIDDSVWVMNVVPTVANISTLGVVYERGLTGTYQDWCEAMSTYPRTYDLIHAASLFTLYKDRCDIEDILLEMDRILRPEGAVIFRDDVDILVKVKSFTDGMRWDSQLVDHEKGPHQREKILVAVKKYWTIQNPNE